MLLLCPVAVPGRICLPPGGRCPEGADEECGQKSVDQRIDTAFLKTEDFAVPLTRRGGVYGFCNYSLYALLRCPAVSLPTERLRCFCRPFGVPDIFLADDAAASAIDPGTHLCSALSATGSAEQRGRCHSLGSLLPPPAALPSFPCCGARQFPCRRSGCVICRPLPLPRLPSSATGGGRLVPLFHFRASPPKNSHIVIKTNALKSNVVYITPHAWVKGRFLIHCAIDLAIPLPSASLTPSPRERGFAHS